MASTAPSSSALKKGVGYFNTHEWVGSGAEPLKPVMGAPAPVVRPTWHAVFLSGQVVAVTNRDDLPAGSPEHTFLTEHGVHSTMMVPLLDGNRLFGVIGFDYARPDRTWPPDVVFLLTSIGRAVSSVILRIEAARAEADTRRSLTATLNALPDLVIELAPTGEVVTCHSDKLPWLSSLIRAGIGRPLAEVMPEPLAKVLQDFLAKPPPDDTSFTRRVGLSTLVSPHRYEVSVARLQPGPSGGTANLLAVIRDISASDQTTEMLSFRESQFTAFFEMCPHAILLNDLDTGLILDGNRAFREIFALDPHAGDSISVRQILPESGQWLIEGALAGLKASNSYGPVEATFRSSSGTPFPAVVRCFLSVDPNGRRLVWSLIENMTEIRAKEAALQAESHALAATKVRLLAAIEALDDGFAIFDAEDRLVLWNSPYVRIFRTDRRPDPGRRAVRRPVARGD